MQSNLFIFPRLENLSNFLNKIKRKSQQQEKLSQMKIDREINHIRKDSDPCFHVAQILMTRTRWLKPKIPSPKHFRLIFLHPLKSHVIIPKEDVLLKIKMLSLLRGRSCSCITEYMFAFNAVLTITSALESLHCRMLYSSVSVSINCSLILK